MRTIEQRAELDNFELADHYDFSDGIRGRFYHSQKITATVQKEKTMQTVPVNETLLSQVMKITGMKAAEAVEESLRIALEAYTRKPNRETRETLEAADRGEDLHKFDNVEDMLADLKDLK